MPFFVERAKVTAQEISAGFATADQVPGKWDDPVENPPAAGAPPYC
ncbi:hypothetical protein ABZ511_20385 [Nocardia gamkensis]